MILRFFFSLILFCHCHYYSIAQENGGVCVQFIHTETNEDNIVQPQFDGGETALYKYFTDNIKYPLLLVDIEMEGETLVKVNIGKDGSINDVKFLKGFDPLADDRIESVLKAMPKWIPGSINETPVDMSIELKVSFTLNNDLRNYVKDQKKNGISIEELDKAENDSRKKAIPINDKTTKATTEGDTINNKPPEFPGGQKALEAYLKKNLKYPKKAIENKLEGRVIFNITVSATGEITDIIFRNGFHYECNEEAYYLIKKMPDWTPGLKKGKPTSMQIILTIPFILPEQTL